ncbi:glycosyltransferase family 4 protein [Planctomicrobium piriforme]|uniref:Glycosyl transferases group 1 n=1 Tax=Planctomicrobium piriforme TaxID=1576369 RepID=A0A1I3JA53_9PLAN|nr:glycosyltransferase family 4 protein [Planctomicrobium piriforme]SFI57073.1 Glycosyl transferases group 1 [Planctomicrobium piriforme]
MRLVQVCNVGQICGGTAACAWTIAKSFPDWEHELLFLSPPTPETRRAFAPLTVKQVDRVDDKVLARFAPHLVILHNTAVRHIGRIEQCPTLQYCHSMGEHAAATLTVACSCWLSQKLPRAVPVLYQPVPRPSAIGPLPLRHLADTLIVGRICTPQRRKWPRDLLDFYAHLAERFPETIWEFVGCPGDFQPDLQVACRHRAEFHPASWDARQLLGRWHALLYHHPTLTESFGRTVSEAMRAGCVPIVDRRGGFVEQVRTDKNGFLCQNINEFAAAISALSQSARWWSMSKAARSTADENFSLRAFRRRFLAMLNQEFSVVSHQFEPSHAFQKQFTLAHSD